MKCHCHSGRVFSECCEPFLTNAKAAVSCEQLMRSRFSAFVTHNESYLLQTWHDSTRPEAINFDAGLEWLGLTILRAKKGRAKDSEGWVTFKAVFKTAEGEGVHHEKSYFVKNEAGAWQYVDGTLFDTSK